MHVVSLYTSCRICLFFFKRDISSIGKGDIIGKNQKSREKGRKKKKEREKSKWRIKRKRKRKSHPTRGSFVIKFPHDQMQEKVDIDS